MLDDITASASCLAAGDDLCRQSNLRPSNRQALLRSAPNFRVGRLYAAGSALLCLATILLGSWFWLLLWPATSLALIAIAYVRGNSALFRKTNGRLPTSTRLMLGPYLCGAVGRLWFYNRGRKPWVVVAPRVYRGRLLTNEEALIIREIGITGVLDLTAEHSEARAFLTLDYLNVPVLDLTSPSRAQLDAAVAFIAKHAESGGVYVHCALGISRSATAVSAYLDLKRSPGREAV